MLRLKDVRLCEKSKMPKGMSEARRMAGKLLALNFGCQRPADS